MTDHFPIDEARAAKAARDSWIRKLGEGRVKASAVLRKPPEPLKKTDIWEILLACRGLGREGVRVILERAVIWPHTGLGELTKNERYRIIKCLPKRAQ